MKNALRRRNKYFYDSLFRERDKEQGGKILENEMNPPRFSSSLYPIPFFFFFILPRLASICVGTVDTRPSVSIRVDKKRERERGGGKRERENIGVEIEGGERWLGEREEERACGYNRATQPLK